jgi:hypothetical protein
MIEANDESDGRSDFDFLFGEWNVANRKLTDVLDPECIEWTSFVSTARIGPLLSNLANMDCYSTVEFPECGAMEGITLRLFNPRTRLWRIWWASTREPGVLDTPVEGRFAGDIGEFYSEEVLNGVPVRVRYMWTRTDPLRPHWAQAFSYDRGTTWKTNWTMRLTRSKDF